jgi:hypothetical protein
VPEINGATVHLPSPIYDQAVNAHHSIHAYLWVQNGVLEHLFLLKQNLALSSTLSTRDLGPVLRAAVVAAVAGARKKDPPPPA